MSPDKDNEARIGRSNHLKTNRVQGNSSLVRDNTRSHSRDSQVISCLVSTGGVKTILKMPCYTFWRGSSSDPLPPSPNRLSPDVQTHGSRRWRIRVAPPERIGRITDRLCRGGMPRRRVTRSNACSGRSKRVHARRRTRTRPRPTHNSHARVGALTVHHPDWMDRHSSGSRQHTHGTLAPVRGETVGGSSHVHKHVTMCAYTTKLLITQTILNFQKLATTGSENIFITNFPVISNSKITDSHFPKNFLVIILPPMVTNMTSGL